MACFIKSNRVMREIIALFFKSQITSWFGKGVFGKSNRAIRKVIAETNHVLFFKVESCLGLEREHMYALHAGSNNRYGSVGRK
jgi:hypothetical protein